MNMEGENQTNLFIVDGEPFFAHEFSMNFTPTQFSLDFKCITPRTDPRSKGAVSFQMKHSVVMIDPWHMKMIAGVMNQMVEKYEKEFGVIKKPKAIEIAEKKQKAESPGITKQAPNYFG